MKQEGCNLQCQTGPDSKTGTGLTGWVVSGQDVRLSGPQFLHLEATWQGAATSEWAVW